MKSAVRRVLLLSALLSPNALYALGLGEIHLHSGLNQPFDADIDLVSAADEDLSAFRATLASNDTFAHYGLDKPAYLSEFTFKVYRSSTGKDVLKVSSLRPVTEPFVTLLVEADWPRGKLLREYTVLLDPPVYAPASQTAEQPVAAPRVQGGAGQQAPAPAPRPEPSKPAAAPSVPAAQHAAETGSTATAGSTYRVRPNDTLWKIASEAHPGTRSDVNRAMVAIYQANEHAFAGNINVLRSGSLLRIPEASAVQAISASAAAEEVSRQYRLWREGASAAQPGAASGRLRLVTPEQGTAAASTATTAAPAATPGTGASTPELQARVQQLESQLAEARRLLEVRNAELATLQGQTAAGQPGAAQPAAPATPAPGAAAPVGATPPATGQAEPTPSTQPAAAAAPQPAAPPKPAAAPQQARKPAPAEEEGPTLGERLAGFWWVALGLLAAALAVLFYRRSRGESGEKEANLQEALARSKTDLRSRTPVERESAIVVEERRPAEPAAVAKPAAAPSVPKAAAGPRAPEPTRKAPSVDDTISGEGPVSIEAGDPLAEADFHMAYGLYDQAADLVQLAIKRSPQRRDLKLKLLEIFFVWGNKDRFLEVAREMNATRGDAQPAEWDKVLIMGKQIAPEDPLFAGAAGPLESSLDMELHGSQGPLDMDLGADQGSTPDVGVPAGVAAAAGDSLDFDLGDATHAEATAPTIETPRIKAKPGASEEPTQEVPIEDLGLDVGEDLLTVKTKAVVEDTVESPRISSKPDAADDGEDLLDATGILKDQTGVLPALEITGEVPEIDLSERTGELPTIKTMKLPVDSPGGLNLSFTDEPTTMSEVGTKLDLARAYVDMGDPEGARSILDEVLKEGSPQQKQEAERLLASLP